MEFKIDTKEKFSVVTPNQSDITGEDADELSAFALEQAEKAPKNLIFNLENIENITEEAAQSFASLYGTFMEKEVSLVFCHLHPEVKRVLEKLDLTDILNITPTESEAWDIVQMEEMEREMFGSSE